jgi:hypothetical protein
MSRFLDDVHIVEALNEPVNDSGSEGDVLETEHSPSGLIPIQVCDHIVYE